MRSARCTLYSVLCERIGPAYITNLYRVGTPSYHLNIFIVLHLSSPYEYTESTFSHTEKKKKKKKRNKEKKKKETILSPDSIP